MHPHFIAQTNHTKSIKQRYHSLSTEIKDHLGVFLLELSREATEADAKSLEGLGSGGGSALPWPLLLLLEKTIPPRAAAAVATGSGGSRRLGGLGTLAQREHGCAKLWNSVPRLLCSFPQFLAVLAVGGRALARGSRSHRLDFVTGILYF